MQLSERFEANYHEMLSHLPVNILIGASYKHKEFVKLSPSPQGSTGVDRTETVSQPPKLRALILGGGDGGVLNRCTRLLASL